MTSIPKRVYLVRAYKTAGVTQPGALAIVQKFHPYEPEGRDMIDVKWIDTRANCEGAPEVRQSGGNYYV